MPIGTAVQFQGDLAAFAKAIGRDVRTVRRKVTLDLFTKIVLRTPVDQGRLRASWAVSDGSPLALDPVGPDGSVSAGAAASMARANIKARFAGIYDVTWISTGLPYATAIEYGHSKKEPAGMVRVSVAEIEAELRGKMEQVSG